MLVSKTEAFGNSIEPNGQSISQKIPQSEPCEEFPQSICFSPAFPEGEIVPRGFCQLLLTGYRHLYNKVQRGLKLPELSEEPDIIRYEDKSYALSWCPDFIYRADINEVYDHEAFCKKGPRQKKAHISYFEGRFKEKQELEDRLQQLFRYEAQPVQTEQNGQLEEMKKENEVLKIKNEELKRENEEMKIKIKAMQEETLKNVATLTQDLDQKLQQKDNDLAKKNQLLEEKEKKIDELKISLEQEQASAEKAKKQQQDQERIIKQEEEKKSANQQTKETREQKKERLLREMKALPDGWDHASCKARAQYVVEHLSKALQWCKKPNSRNICCDGDDGSAALVSTQRCNNHPSKPHLQCWLVHCRDRGDYPSLSELTESVETALLDHWT